MKEMNCKKIIKVLPAEENNPEFKQDQRLIDGLECTGSFILTFDEDGDPKTEFMDGVSVANLAEWIKSRSEVANLFRQASAIAEGEIKAEKIYRETEDGKRMKRIAKMLIARDDD